MPTEAFHTVRHEPLFEMLESLDDNLDGHDID